MTVYGADINGVFIGEGEPENFESWSDRKPPDTEDEYIYWGPHGWDIGLAVDSKGFQIRKENYNSSVPTTIVPNTTHMDPYARWSHTHGVWVHYESVPMAAWGEIMLISDQIGRFCSNFATEHGQNCLHIIADTFPEVGVVKREVEGDDVFEVIHPETGLPIQAQTGTVHESFAYQNSQIGLYVFANKVPEFLKPFYKDPEAEYSGWWGYKFTITVPEDISKPLDKYYSIKRVSKKPELYNTPAIPPGCKAVLHATTVPSVTGESWMDEYDDVYFHPELPTEPGEELTYERIEEIGKWIEDNCGVSAPYMGVPYWGKANFLYGFTYHKETLKIKKAKFYFFSGPEQLADLMQDLIFQGRYDYAGYVPEKRPIITG